MSTNEIKNERDRAQAQLDWTQVKLYELETELRVARQVLMDTPPHLNVDVEQWDKWNARRKHVLSKEQS